LIKRLRSRGLIPAAIVTVLVGAAAIVPSALASTSGGASLHGFLTTAYVCTGVTISAAPTSVVQSTSGGTHVTATAVGTGCSTSPLYEFWLRPATSSVWQMVQPYSTLATYDWNSTGAAAGIVYLGVHVKDASSTAAYDAVASTPVTVTTAPPSVCSVPGITAAPTSVNADPNPGGTHVIATATIETCTTTPRYEFWIRPASVSTWQLVQAYSTLATYNWDSSGALPGVVYLGVHIKDANSTSSAGYDVVASTPVSVNASQCLNPTITPVPATVVHSNTSGTHVIATAAATCTNSARYEFWIRPASSPTWQLVQAYGASATYDWNTTGAAVGTVYIGVHVRDVNSTSSAGYDSVVSAPVTVT
jgi:hypothetical protein